MRWLLVLLMLCCISSVNAVVINEVVPNPSSNAYDEWLEIYNPTNEVLNLTEWQLSITKTYGLTCDSNCSLITSSPFFIIIGKNSDFSRIFNGSIEYYRTNASSSGYILPNAGADISFFNSIYATNMSYNSTQTNKSISRNSDGAGNWAFCTPTPGLANNCSSNNNGTETNNTNNTNASQEEKYDLKLEVKIQNATQGIAAKNLFRLLNLDYKTNQSYMNVTVEFNVKINNSLEYEDTFTVEFKQSKSIGTGSWTPESFGAYMLCGKITNSTFLDTDENNNEVCEDITVYESKENTTSTDVEANKENQTPEISLRNSTTNAGNTASSIKDYTWQSKATPNIAVLLFVGVLLIFVVVLLLMLLRKQNP